MTGVKRLGMVGVCVLAFAVFAAPARADDIWVTPTAQQDFGGLGIASNGVWPASAFGLVRLAWSVPDNLQALQSAKVVLIPHSPAAGPSTLHLYICSSKDGEIVTNNCAGPVSRPFTGVANQLVEVEIAGFLAPFIGTPGANYLAVIAYTTPTTTTDHIVGLRFGYEPIKATGVATLEANTFSGTQTAPAFVGNGAGLTGLPFPAGAATVGANAFSGTQTAPAFVGNGSGLTGLPFPAGAATLGANTFGGTQTIGAGNLDLGYSTTTSGSIMKGGFPFLHDFGGNLFLGSGAGNFTMGAYWNTGVGEGALWSNISGYENVAFGLSALGSNQSGSGNAAVGNFALVNNVHGNNNVAVGRQAGYFMTTGSNNIYLGADIAGAPNESNAIYLGQQGIHTRTQIGGIRGITTGVANAIPVVIDSNGQLGTMSSSVRFKEDIHDMGNLSGRLLKLRPVTFRYTQAYRDGAKPIQYGLVAEEVAEVFPELAVRGADGQVETVHYETLNVLLLNELQKQQAHLDKQAKEQQKQQAHLDEQAEEQQKQARRIEALERQLKELLRKPAGR